MWMMLGQVYVNQGNSDGARKAFERAIALDPSLPRVYAFLKHVATPDEGATFAGWSGGCTGTSSCQVDLTADTLVGATFDKSLPSEPPPEGPSEFPVEPPALEVDKRATDLDLASSATSVRRGRWVGVQATVSQCPDRAWDAVTILRDNRRNRTLTLGRRCAARTHFRIRRDTRLEAEIAADTEYLGAKTDPVTIRVRSRQDGR